MVIKISLPRLHLQRKSDLPLQFRVSWLSEKFTAPKEHRGVFYAVLLLLAATVLQPEATPTSQSCPAAPAKASFFLTKETKVC